MNRYLYIALFTSISLLISGCAKDYLESYNESNFSKLYRASEDIDAVDFIIKPNNAGFLILGNSKTINSANQNSNLILFNVDASGYIINKKEIFTEAYDEGQALYHNLDNEVYILGKRSINISNENTVSSSILIQTNLNGELANYNDTSLYENIREIKYDPAWESISYIQQDMNITGDILILAGYIENTQNGSTSAVARTYALSELFQNYDFEINYNNQIPLASVIPADGLFNNSKFVTLKADQLSNFDLNIYGVKSNANADTDILNYIIQDVNDFRYQSPSIAKEGNQNLKAMIFNNVDNSTICIGNNAGSSPADSLFILRGIYNAENARDSVGFDIISHNQFSDGNDYGNEIIDLAQNRDGEVFVITSRENTAAANNEIISKESFILKFSFTVKNSPEEVANFSIVGNGFHSPKKIKYDEKENVFYILSSVEFSTEETAIELNKVRF